MTPLILDLATTAIDNADQFLDDVKLGNLVDPEKIAAKKAAAAERAALDIDLARITAVGTDLDGTQAIVMCRTEAEEVTALTALALVLMIHQPRLLGFNLLRYDAPLLMRRALYLGVEFPEISIDKFRTPHCDLWDRLSFHGAVSAHALTWYTRRFGWTDLVKPLSGAEEAKAAQDGRWAEIEASVRHDLEAVKRLAQRMGLIARETEPVF